MPIVDATVGGPSANSYVTVADADSYFDSSFNRTLWATASEQEALVISASRLLDSYVSWDGEKTTPDQAMEWPRTGASTKTGRPYPDDEIPMPVRFAVYELAYYLLENNGLSFEASPVDSLKVGPIALKLNQRAKDLGLPAYVVALINHIGSPELSDSNKIHTVKLVRS